MKLLTSLAASAMALAAIGKTNEARFTKDAKVVKSHAPKVGSSRPRKLKEGDKGFWRQPKKRVPTKYADTRQQRRYDARMAEKRLQTKADRRKPRRV